VLGWSPQQIANRLPVDYPGDESMRASHEAIYQALYVQGRGALRRSWSPACGPGGPCAFPAPGPGSKPGVVTPEVLISKRPAEVADWAVPGHWEGDLIISLQRSAIGTLVERTTRFTMLIHLPRGHDYGLTPRTKNGPALAGNGAVTMKNALAATITTMPEQLRRSLTWDRGKEMSQHAAFKVETGVAVYFADPHSPLATRHEREYQRVALKRSRFGLAGQCAANDAMESLFSLLQKTSSTGGDGPPVTSCGSRSWFGSNAPTSRRRRQDTLGRLTPVEFETLLQTAHAAGPPLPMRVNLSLGSPGGYGGNLVRTEKACS
jgi:hypothetical protein